MLSAKVEPDILRNLPEMATPLSHHRGDSVTPGNEDTEMADTLHDNPNDPSTLASVADESNDAMHKVCADSRKLIDFIQKLEAFNIKNILPSLPRFVVVGDQSAGKSSIIEAVCDISLPRGEGTCTRCPFKITTTSSKGDSWTCRISVHQKYSYDMKARSSKSSPYMRWREKADVTITEIATINSKDDVELELRRAQVAILNPDRDPTYFLNIDMSPYMESDNMESQDLISVAFSPNWVAMEISSPNLPELSLYDLPGAINVNSDASKQYLVKFIETLLKSYMSEEKTLILLTCPMNSDIHNSTTFRYIRECDAEERSMGVRTKPDTVRIDRSRLEQEIHVLNNDNFKLGRGWFITKQCSQNEIQQGNISYTDARRMEDDFFAQDIWKSVLYNFQGRLGTRNLQAALSEILTNSIRDEVPVILERVKTRCSEVEQELSKYPAAKEDATITIMRELGQLRSQLGAYMDSDAMGPTTFPHRFRELLKALAKTLQEYNPELNVVTPGWEARTIEIDDDQDEHEDVNLTPSKKKLKNPMGRAVSLGAGQSPSKTRRIPVINASEPVHDHSSGKMTLNLEEIKENLDSATGADIPDQIDPKAIRQLVRDSVGGWFTAVDSLFEGIKELMNSALASAYKNSIEARRDTAFYSEVKRCTAKFLGDMLREHRSRIREVVEYELHKPFTISKTFQVELERLKLIYRNRRNTQRLREYFDDPPEGVKRLSESEQNKKTTDSQWLDNTLGHDDYNREIEAFPRVAAYHNTAGPHFVDHVSKSTSFHVMRSFDLRLHDRLINDLRVADRAHCEHLLTRDPVEQRRFQSLVGEHNKLLATLEELKYL